MLRPVLVTAPSVSPITLTEAKTHLRVDHSDEDTLIQGLIDAAVSHLDGSAGVLGRAMVTQTWQLDFDAFYPKMRLRPGNLLGITSISYFDNDNATQALSASIYSAFTDEIGPYVEEAPDQSWPSTYTRADAVRVTWTAGYGATAASVPAAIRAAMLLMIGHWYANRETVNVGNITSEMPFAAAALLAPHTIKARI